MWRFDNGLAYFDGRLIGATDVIHYASGDAATAVAHVPSTKLAPEPGGDMVFFIKKASGDYCPCDDPDCSLSAQFTAFGFERKSATNLISSWRTGELADQMRRMRANYDWAALIVEGDLSMWLDIEDIAWYTMQTVLLDYMDLGVRLLYTPDIDGTVSYVERLFTKYKEGRATEPLRHMTRPGPVGTQAFTWISGIGVKTAAKILDAYPDVLSAIHASGLDDTLKNVIGAKLAHKVYEAYYD